MIGVILLGMAYLQYKKLTLASDTPTAQTFTPRPYTPAQLKPLAQSKPPAVNWSNTIDRWLDMTDTPAKPASTPNKPAPVFVPNVWITPKAGQVFEPLFIDASKQYALPAGLLSRVAYQESRYNPRAFNKTSNASGMMQLVPKWFPGVDPWDVTQAVPAAARELSTLYRRFGSWAKALAAYNWGQGNLNKYAITPYGDAWLQHTPRETYNYVIDVCKDTGIKI